MSYGEGDLHARVDELERENAELVLALEDVLRSASDTVWAGMGETLVDRMVRIGVYGHDVYEGARPWEGGMRAGDSGRRMAALGIDTKGGERMKDFENGWYLRSDGYMTSEPNYQRIGAMKSDRALENHGRLVFEKYMGGEEVDSRVYFSGKRVEYLESLVRDMHSFIRPVLANPSGYFGCTNPAAAFAVLEERMAALGIDTKGGGE